MKFFSFTLFAALVATVQIVDATKTCAKTQFLWKQPDGSGKEKCLREGGNLPEFKPPKGIECPKDWQYCIINKICYPQHQVRPRPKCPHGKFDYKHLVCHCPSGTGPHHSPRALVPDVEKRHFVKPADPAPAEARSEKKHNVLESRQFKMRKVNNARANAL